MTTNRQIKGKAPNQQSMYVLDETLRHLEQGTARSKEEVLNGTGMTWSDDVIDEGRHLIQQAMADDKETRRTAREAYQAYLEQHGTFRPLQKGEKIPLPKPPNVVSADAQLIAQVSEEERALRMGTRRVADWTIPEEYMGPDAPEDVILPFHRMRRQGSDMRDTYVQPQLTKEKRAELDQLRDKLAGLSLERTESELVKQAVKRESSHKKTASNPFKSSKTNPFKKAVQQDAGVDL